MGLGQAGPVALESHLGTMYKEAVLNWRHSWSYGLCSCPSQQWDYREGLLGVTWQVNLSGIWDNGSRRQGQGQEELP